MERTLVAWARSSKSQFVNDTCVKVGATYHYEWLWPQNIAWDNGHWYRTVFRNDVDANFNALGWIVQSVQPSWTYNGIKDFPPEPSCGPNCTIMTRGRSTVWHLCKKLDLFPLK